MSGYRSENSNKLDVRGVLYGCLKTVPTALHGQYAHYQPRRGFRWSGRVWSRPVYSIEALNSIQADPADLLNSTRTERRRTETAQLFGVCWMLRLISARRNWIGDSAHRRDETRLIVSKMWLDYLSSPWRARPLHPCDVALCANWMNIFFKRGVTNMMWGVWRGDYHLHIMHF